MPASEGVAFDSTGIVKKQEEPKCEFRKSIQVACSLYFVLWEGG